MQINKRQPHSFQDPDATPQPWACLHLAAEYPWRGIQILQANYIPTYIGSENVIWIFFPILGQKTLQE